MPQNRKRLIDLFVGTISTAIAHEILIEATRNKEIASHYEKEIKNSISRCEKYREKINPVNQALSDKDIEYIKSKITIRVKSELNRRIRDGYKNVDLQLILPITEKYLKETKVI